DAAGNSSAPAQQNATKDTIAPAVAITALPSQIITSNQANVSVSGTGEVGAKITVVAGDGSKTVTSTQVMVGADGTWSVSGLNVPSLKDGTINFTATATDTAGNSANGQASATKDTVVPTVSLLKFSSPVSSANAHNASASGTGEVGATISVVVSIGAATTLP